MKEFQQMYYFLTSAVQPTVTTLMNVDKCWLSVITSGQLSSGHLCNVLNRSNSTLTGCKCPPHLLKMIGITLDTSQASVQECVLGKRRVKKIECLAGLIRREV